MPDPITKPVAAAPAAKPVARPAAKPAAPAAEAKAFDSDFFNRTPPTKAQLDADRAAVAALDALPKVPLGREAKREWLAANKPKIEAAKKGLDALEDAAFWHKSVPQAELDVAREKLWKLEDKLQGIEEAAGTIAPTKPASPIRPLYQLTDGCKDMMGRNPLLAIVGIVAIIPAMVIDTVDMVTRPLQAIAYPVLWGQYKMRDIQYDREHPAPAAKP